MDYLKKLLNIKELTHKRLEQLGKEENLDNCLNKSFQNCPDLVFSYLMKTRELNRKYAKETYNSSILDYPEQVEKNLKLVDQMYEKYSTNCPDQLCYKLPVLLKELEKL